ncbi:MAG: hypothetical protein KC516_02870 [Nanoarchaeota archaeon]|nr:hypothetical protein [Nanoarchaeota archaeon]
MGKRIFKKSRHIRWNWEQSPDDSEMVRYHFVVVDDKDRDGKIAKIMHNALKKSIVSYPFNPIREDLEGRVGNSGLRYLFETYDTKYSSEFMDPSKIFERVVKDPNLKERVRKGFSVEDYVADFYDV